MGVIDIIKTRGFQSQEDRPANFTESGFCCVSMCVWHSGIGGVRSSVCFRWMMFSSFDRDWDVDGDGSDDDTQVSETDDIIERRCG